MTGTDTFESTRPEGTPLETGAITAEDTNQTPLEASATAGVQVQVPDRSACLISVGTPLQTSATVGSQLPTETSPITGMATPVAIPVEVSKTSDKVVPETITATAKETPKPPVEVAVEYL